MPGGGEKTEKATPRRREKAREKGQVAKSRELTGAITTMSIIVFFIFMGSSMIKSMASAAGRFFTFKYGQDPITVLRAAELELFYLLFPILFTVAISALATELMQVGFMVKSFEFSLSKINPLKGVKRLFSAKSVSEFFKSLIKFSAGVLLIYVVVRKNLDEYPLLMVRDFHQIVSKAGELVLWALIYGLIYILLVAVISYLLNIWSHEKSIMMSKQEVKEELKETDGDPKVKSKIRKIQREMSRKRMMAEVPNATVVVTNPTHIAVALYYEDKVTIAPKVVAKGVDRIALKIKEIAKEHKVPIVEDKPLARLLLEVEINSHIPPDLYKAVAKVLAYIYKLKGLAG